MSTVGAGEQPPRLAWHNGFRDAKLEKAFVAQELHTRISRAGVYLSCASSVFIGALVGREVGAYGRHSWVPSIGVLVGLALAGVSTCGLAPFYAYAPEKLRVGPHVLEALFTAQLCLLAMYLAAIYWQVLDPQLALHDGAGRSYEGRPQSLYVGNPGPFSRAEIAARLDTLVPFRVTLLMAYATAFAPIRPLSYVLLWVGALAAFFAAVSIHCRIQYLSHDGALELSCSALVLLFVRREREATCRLDFHARSSAIRVAREHLALELRAAAEAHEKGVAMAVTGARGRLIRMVRHLARPPAFFCAPSRACAHLAGLRMHTERLGLRTTHSRALRRAFRTRCLQVMHDLRSPILSISNIAETLADMLQIGDVADAGIAGAGSGVGLEREALPLDEVKEQLVSLRVCSELVEHIVSDMCVPRALSAPGAPRPLGRCDDPTDPLLPTPSGRRARHLSPCAAAAHLLRRRMPARPSPFPGSTLNGSTAGAWCSCSRASRPHSS